jgi:uncharacterized protein YaaN involved in tellurite resistance
MSTETKETPAVEAVEVITDTTVTTANGQELTVTSEENAKMTSFIETIKNSQTDDNTSARAIISSIGSEEVTQMKGISNILKSEKIGHIQDLEGDDSDVATNLIELRTAVEKINPQGVNFDHPNFLMGLVYKVLGGTPAQKYLTKFETSEDVISGISSNLNNGKLMLQEDNASFGIDKKRFINAMRALEEKINLLMVADTRVTEMAEVEEDKYEKQFLQEEVVFVIRQHTMDLQQILAVTQQGIMALDILMKNNNELMTSVDRAVNTTMPLLTIGLTIARGLANQKRVLETVKRTNEVAGNMLTNNAKLLKEQGAEIQKQAMGSAIDVETIRNAMSETLDAIKQVEEFKMKALPEMKKAIGDLNSISNESSSKIAQLEKGAKVKELL